MTIILIGYMGSGKSSIGQKLDKSLNFDSLDFDMYIQDREGMSIADVFKHKGEIYFRKMESHYLSDVLSLQNSIVSLGGGTPCYGNNMQRINDASNVKSIYLKASILTLVERLYTEKESRPLIAHLQSKDELTEFIGKHLFERSYFYSQADVTISVDGKTIDEISEEIVKTLF